ncbi:MAG: DNA primase [Actinomycetota bacterium]|nr:DNA primase [Actinomycetota bacterium]
MAISDDDVARVRAATDVVALVGEHAALRRQGRRWVGLCPFHQEKSPSFSVNAEEGLYYCFGCQRSGDVITFVRDVEHVDFVEAVRRLADRAGITITEDESATAERRRRAPLYEALERAVAWYHERLLRGDDAGAARQYLRSRGFTGELVRQFRLGWAPDAWDELARALQLPAGVLEGAGLGFVNRAGRLQDAFRARLLFPICDPSGRPIALGGRVLPGAEQSGPKYKNSPDGPLYAKRRVLYALNWAKHDVIASGQVVVCEGYTDVIGCFSAGLPRAVATCGTALGEEHFRLLSNFARTIVLAYDADTAGQAGAGRVYEWERGHRVDVLVASLPPGSDPGDLACRDPDALRRAVADAQPFMQFRVDQVLAAADLRHPEGRARAAEAALAAVAEHPGALVRDQYLMVVADRCRLDPAALRPILDRLVAADAREQGSSARAPARPAFSGDAPGASSAPAARRISGSPGAPSVDSPGGFSPGSARSSSSERAGMEALRLAVHRPDEVASRLHRVLFFDPHQRAAFDALLAEDHLHRAIEHAGAVDPPAAQLLCRIAVEEPAAEADDVIAQLVRNAVRRALGALQTELRLAPERLAELAAETAEVRGYLEELEAGTPDPLVFERLLAWLGRRGEEDG